MTVNQLGDPCIPVDREDEDGGDEMTQDMKTLFKLANNAFGTEWINKQQIYLLVDQEQADLFSWINLGERRGQTILGKALNRFNKRCLDAALRPKNYRWQEQPPVSVLKDG